MFENMNILIPFFKESGRRFHLRELAKILKLSPATVKKKTAELGRRNLIIKNRERNLVLFSANVDNPNFREFKKAYSVQMLMNSGLVEFLEKKFNYPAIILFGSTAKADDTPSSDIDIFILSENKKHVDLTEFEGKLGKKIQLLVMNSNAFENAKKSNPNLVNNILNGVKLSGFLRVIS